MLTARASPMRRRRRCTMSISSRTIRMRSISRHSMNCVRYYSDADIAELTMFLFYNLGLHTFFGSLKFYPMFSPDGRLVSQEESARLYGDSPASLAGRAREMKRRGKQMMSFIPPVPIDKIEDAELRAMIVRCDELGVPGARIWPDSGAQARTGEGRLGRDTAFALRRQCRSQAKGSACASSWRDLPRTIILPRYVQSRRWPPG